MTRRFKILTFQAAVIAGSAFMMASVASITKAAPAPATAAVSIDNFTFKAPVVTVKP